MKKILVACGVILAVALLYCASSFASCKVGDKAEVLWKGKWYPAKVMKVKGDECYIHYNGYGNNWDEWVGPDRIKLAKAGEQSADPQKYSKGDSVQVLWKGTWYPAKIIAIGKNEKTYKIHYDGYNKSWDEWVGPDRMK